MSLVEKKFFFVILNQNHDKESVSFLLVYVNHHCLEWILFIFLKEHVHLSQAIFAIVGKWKGHVFKETAMLRR